MLFGPSSPIIVNIAPPAPKAMSFGEVLLSAAGFTLTILIGAALLGLVLGALFIGYHKLRPRNRFNGQTADRDIPLGLGASRGVGSQSRIPNP